MFKRIQAKQQLLLYFQTIRFSRNERYESI